MKTLTWADVAGELDRADRQDLAFASVMIKMLGTMMTTAFVAGMTGDPWLASVILVGYPAAWSVAWLLSRP